MAELTPEAWAGFKNALGTYVRRRVGPAEADDLISDILVRLVLHQGALAAATHPLAWLRRTAANAIADHYRSRAAERRALDRAGQESALSHPTATLPDAAPDAAADIAACLMPFIHELPEADRDALLLTDLGGMTQSAAASQLGLSASGMKSRVQRARAKLKRRLLRCCAIETDRRGGIVDYQRRTTPCRPTCMPVTKNAGATAAHRTAGYSGHPRTGAP